MISLLSVLVTDDDAVLVYMLDTDGKPGRAKTRRLTQDELDRLAEWVEALS